MRWCLRVALPLSTVMAGPNRLFVGFALFGIVGAVALVASLAFFSQRLFSSLELPGALFRLRLSADKGAETLYLDNRCSQILGQNVSRRDFLPFLLGGQASGHPGKLEHALTEAASQGKSWEHETTVRDEDGGERWIHVVATPVQTERETLFSGIIMDFSERKRMEEQLREKEERYRTVFENTGVATLIVGSDTTILQVNRRFEEITGYPKGEVEGRIRWTEMVAGEDLEWMLEQHRLRRANAGQALTSYEFHYHTKSGKRRAGQLSIDIIPGTSESIASLADITEMKHAQDELYRLAFYDKLTGLPNKMMLLQQENRIRSQSAHREGCSAALFIVDVHQLKMTNDTLGHDAGDELLRSVAERLQQAVPAGAGVFRVGDDEFGVLVQGLAEEEEAAAMARQLVGEVEGRRFAINHLLLFQGVHVGYSCFPQDGRSIDRLLRTADIALRQVCSEPGSSKTARYDRSRDRVREHFSAAQDIREAFREEQFLLYYQPQVELVSGERIGAEALLRWHSPERGIVPPGEFLPILEETRLMEQVGQWVVSQAAGELQRRHERGVTMPMVTVNCSARELYNQETQDMLLQVAATTAERPYCFGVEITEQVAMGNVDEVASLLQRFSQAGLVVLLDDFGTGYSSLELLHRLPLDIVKIDKSFIRHIDRDDRGFAMVEGVLSLCHALGFTVMAEGIETELQRGILTSLGCDYGQGYLFGRPAPPDLGP
ncbi:MAG: EAL domain-containing protein [Synergistales bacterium]|nr:EAL domain-containing protein [Synergistales bacterium]